ncbi:hypothetical protein [Nocardioides sp. KR10-350]|uniref:hypothetical protein n=1 Tax=Nocardioides cheoyonin TaxID=3156615 RepID=UPI0032B45AF3
MSLDVEPQTSTPTPPRSPWRWVAAAVAVAVLVVAAAASAVLWLGEGDDGHTDGGLRADPSAAASTDTGAASDSASDSASGSQPLALTVTPQTGRCLLPSADRLKSGATLAFEATVGEVDQSTGTAVLDVTKWLFSDGFGGTDTVRIALPARTTESTPTFAPGHTYLVAAGGDAQVMGCGFTGEKTPRLTRLYAAAFR